MSHADDLVARMRDRLIELGAESLTEKRMFGGVGFMVHGNMACGEHKGRVIVRVGSPDYEALLALPGVSPFDITGRPMKGWVMVDGQVCDADEDLAQWVERGLTYARTLPPK